MLGFLDWLLPGDHHHRHSAQRGIGRRRHEIGRTRPECRDANAGFPGMSPISRSHKACTLLMPRQDQLDLVRAGQRIKEIEIFLTRNAENIFAALFFKALDEKV